MPNVSGSPTQVATSVAHASELPGVPDDQFDTGDLAWADDQGMFRLNRGTNAAANGVSTFETLSGNGLWELFIATPQTSVQELVVDTVLPDVAAAILTITVVNRGFPFMVTYSMCGSSAGAGVAIGEAEPRADGVGLLSRSACTSTLADLPATCGGRTKVAGVSPATLVNRVFTLYCAKGALSAQNFSVKPQSSPVESMVLLVEEVI